MNKESACQFQLRDLQQSFVNNLTARNPDPVFLSQLEESGDLSVANRFNIYSNNRRVGLVKALATTYPVCQRLVGEKYFRAMVNTYVEQYPSTSPNLNDYGSYLAEALLDSPFVLDLPYLIDVIRLEWHVHRILIGPDACHFDWGTLSSVSNDHYSDLIFCRSENSVLMHSRFPVDRIWETNQADFVGDDRVDLAEGEVYLLIWRLGFDISIVRLTPLQWMILNALDGKRSLGELQTALTEKKEVGTAQAIIESLPALIKAGYIAKFSL